MKWNFTFLKGTLCAWTTYATNIFIHQIQFCGIGKIQNGFVAFLIRNEMEFQLWTCQVIY